MTRERAAVRTTSFNLEEESGKPLLARARSVQRPRTGNTLAFASIAAAQCPSTALRVGSKAIQLNDGRRTTTLCWYNGTFQAINGESALPAVLDVTSGACVAGSACATAPLAWQHQVIVVPGRQRR
jgi:hypothetical protein